MHTSLTGPPHTGLARSLPVVNLLPCRPSSDMSAYFLMRSPTPSVKHLVSCLSCWASSPILWTPLDRHKSPRACCLLVLSLQGRFLTPSLPMTLPEGSVVGLQVLEQPDPFPPPKHHLPAPSSLFNMFQPLWGSCKNFFLSGPSSFSSLLITLFHLLLIRVTTA